MPTFKLKRYGPKKHYYVFWTEDGRSERRSSRTSELKVAEKWRDNLVRDLLTPRDASPSEVEIGLVLDRYQDEKGMGTASEKSNRIAITGFKKFYGEHMTVSELTIGRHIDYEKHCRKKLGQMASTINKRRNVLIAALNHARKNNILSAVPHVPMLPTPPTTARHFVRDEAARLIRAARKFGWQHLVMFIRIGMYTGARATAILQLTWDRVDLVKGRVDFRLPGVVESKKRRPNAPINPVLLRALRVLRKKSNGDNVILYRGNPIGLIRSSFMDACKEAGIKNAGPHTLKHTFITWALQNGVTPFRVSGLTATSVATILRVYGHHVQDDLQEAANALVGRHAQRTRNASGI